MHSVKLKQVLILGSIFKIEARLLSQKKLALVRVLNLILFKGIVAEVVDKCYYFSIIELGALLFSKTELANIIATYKRTKLLNYDMSKKNVKNCWIRMYCLLLIVIMSGAIALCKTSFSFLDFPLHHFFQKLIYFVH